MTACVQFRPPIALRTDLSHITTELWEISMLRMAHWFYIWLHSTTFWRKRFFPSLSGRHVKGLWERPVVQATPGGRKWACVSNRQAFPLARRSEIGRQLIKMLSIARSVWQNNWYSMNVAIRYQHKIYICNEAFQCLEAMIDKVFTRLWLSSAKIGDERWHNLNTVLSLLRPNKCKQTAINVL